MLGDAGDMRYAGEQRDWKLEGRSVAFLSHQASTCGILIQYLFRSRTWKAMEEEIRSLIETASELRWQDHSADLRLSASPSASCCLYSDSGNIRNRGD